jgi:hypothetical protein
MKNLLILNIFLKNSWVEANFLKKSQQTISGDKKDYSSSTQNKAEAELS